MNVRADTVDLYAARRIRVGKTSRDHKNGAHRRRESNNATRAAWCRLSNSDREKTKFPINVCNGKKSRALMS